MSKKKRTNPNRIPVAYEKIDKSELLASVSHNNMYYAWLLAIPAILEQDGMTREKVIGLWDKVNDYVSSPSFTGSRLKRELSELEKGIGSHAPYPNVPVEDIRTKADLESVRRKLRKNALYTAICMILIGLRKTDELDYEVLRRIYLNADLTLAEIEHGYTSYEDLRSWAMERDIIVTEDREGMSLESTPAT